MEQSREGGVQMRALSACSVFVGGTGSGSFEVKRGEAKPRAKLQPDTEDPVTSDEVDGRVFGIQARALWSSS